MVFLYIAIGLLTGPPAMLPVGPGESVAVTRGASDGAPVVVMIPGLSGCACRRNGRTS